MYIRIKNYQTSWKFIDSGFVKLSYDLWTYSFLGDPVFLFHQRSKWSWWKTLTKWSSLSSFLGLRCQLWKKSTDVINVALFQKLFWTTVRNNFLVIYKNLSMQIQGWRPRIHKLFEITRYKQFVWAVKVQNNFWSRILFLHVIGTIYY